MDPTTPVRCERFRCTLSAKACATRHGARWASGGRRGAKRFLVCGSCPVGARIAAELEAGGWTRPGDQDPPEVLPFSQRAARARSRCWAPLDGELDPMREAALATPDDLGLEVGEPDL